MQTCEKQQWIYFLKFNANLWKATINLFFEIEEYVQEGFFLSRIQKHWYVMKGNFPIASHELATILVLALILWNHNGLEVISNPIKKKKHIKKEAMKITANERKTCWPAFGQSPLPTSKSRYMSPESRFT